MENDDLLNSAPIDAAIFLFKAAMRGHMQVEILAGGNHLLPCHSTG
jgi:hypothetical protein